MRHGGSIDFRQNVVGQITQGIKQGYLIKNRPVWFSQNRSKQRVNGRCSPRHKKMGLIDHGERALIGLKRAPRLRARRQTLQTQPEWREGTAGEPSDPQQLRRPNSACQQQIGIDARSATQQLA